jgi:predicted Rossmann fold nucleotide-binding protein DprA/Smf involved in DNA uptake
VISTGLGYARHSIIANTSDGALVICGWIGSASLAIHFLAQGKPVVAIQSSGGIADSLGGRQLIEDTQYLIHQADSARSALSKLRGLLAQKTSN